VPCLCRVRCLCLYPWFIEVTHLNLEGDLLDLEDKVDLEGVGNDIGYLK